jgi:ubiquitin-like 1-activating enzyme E1 A
MVHGGRMRNASVLVITLRGIAVEVVKNIVLAGVGSITILDDQEVKGEDLGANYFVREEEVGLKVRPLFFSPV